VDAPDPDADFFFFLGFFFFVVGVCALDGFEVA
jgi:hypothetical protein